MKQSLDLDSLGRTQAQDSLHSPWLLLRTGRTEPISPAGAWDSFLPLPALRAAGLSPTLSVWSRAQLPAFGKGAGGKAERTVCTPGMQASWPTHKAMSSSGSTATVQTRSATPSPSVTQPQGSAAEGTAPLITELAHPAQAWEDVGNPVPLRARVDFLTISHMSCGCPGLASPHLPWSYSSALWGRAFLCGSDLRPALMPSSELQAQLTLLGLVPA